MSTRGLVALAIAVAFASCQKDSSTDVPIGFGADGGRARLDGGRVDPIPAADGAVVVDAPAVDAPSATPDGARATPDGARADGAPLRLDAAPDGAPPPVGMTGQLPGTDARLITFAWSGGVGPRRAQVKTQLAADTPAVYLWVSTSPEFSDARRFGPAVAAEATNHRTVAFDLGGLVPGQTYHYAVATATAVDRTQAGRFRTPREGAFSYKVLVGSCANTGSVHPIFTQMAREEALFMLHNGDFQYESELFNSVSAWRAAYDRVLTSPVQAALYRSLPIVYTWDDHDAGGSRAGRDAYELYVPHHPFMGISIAHAFTVGRVRYVVTDVRTQASPWGLPDDANKSMLGAQQKAWWKREVAEASRTHAVVVWVNTAPWIGTGSSTSDRWYSYTTERRELANHVKAEGIKNLVIVSGDAHMVAIDEGRNADYAEGGGAPIPVFHASPLDRPPSIKGGPYSLGAFQGTNQYGVMTVHDEGGSNVRVEWVGKRFSEAMGVRDLVRHEMTFPAAGR